jgi:hypothetical protein
MELECRHHCNKNAHFTVRPSTNKWIAVVVHDWYTIYCQALVSIFIIIIIIIIIIMLPLATGHFPPVLLPLNQQ